MLHLLDSVNSPFKSLLNRLFLFGLHFSIIFGPSFILAQKSGLCFSYLEKRFLSVNHLNAAITVNPQHVYMTTLTGYC